MITGPHIPRPAMALALFFAATAASAQTDLGDRALELVNDSRAQAGLDALTESDVLNEAAQAHATAMLQQDFYSHVAPDGQTPRDRFLAAGGGQWAQSGENLATCSGCETPADIARVEAFHDGWMHSPGHRENILSQGFERFGYATVGEDGRIYAVQTFAGPGATDGDRLSPAAAREAALSEVNARRAESGLDPLEPSSSLDTLAERVLDARLSEEEMPENIFGLLPEGSDGWTSLSLQSATRGGAGTEMTGADVAGFVDTWSGSGGAALGGGTATALGFAATATDEGRKTAVAVFGGRD
ncbi:hypothetical protein PAA8504_00569 [Palleronia abyssalis]|uniref:SCP domain-containing protein n=2 Tax=Palleronia abyssalis TaxID=1501240 RepID=A0A2R8BRL7_9RHOB|nr:hypothetical protein PAA8504_00569 [Palleronia abyssalis]